MSRKKWEKLEIDYAEAIKFQDAIKELQFESIGEFVELIGGLMGMINVNDIDNAKKISEAFALRIGYIIDKIGYADKVIDKNKTMRDFYEEQQQRLEAQKEAQKEADEAEEQVEENEPTDEEQWEAEYKDYRDNGTVEGEENLQTVELDEEFEGKIEDQVTSMMGRNPFKGLTEEEKELARESQGKTVEPAMMIQLDPSIMESIKKSQDNEES